jgi:hypothetical protein
MIVNLLATRIPALIIALLGVLKLVGNRRAVDELTVLGVRHHLLYSASWKWLSPRYSRSRPHSSSGSYSRPATSAARFATELSHGKLKANPFVPIVLFWIGAFIRDRSIFL